MRYGSVCSGIGALDLVIEELFGATPAWFCEVDKDASKVLARHWPHVPNLGDIKAIDWSTVEPVDLLCGGPPCQAVSVAGKRLGPADDRFVWPWVLDAVERLRPGRLVFENPPGIAPWLPAIIRRLAGMGYVGRYGRFTADSVGACHRRERVFIVAADADARTPADADCGRLTLDNQPDSGPLQSRQQAPRRLDPHRCCTTTAYSIDPRRRRENGGGCSCHEAAQDGTRREPGRTGRPDRFDWGSWQPAVDRHGAVLRRPAPWPVVDGTRSLSGEFTEWMMMLPEGWLDRLSNTAKKRVCGNAVVPAQAAAAIQLLAGGRDLGCRGNGARGSGSTCGSEPWPQESEETSMRGRSNGDRGGSD